MAASRSSRVTRSSSVGLNGLDENFCGRTLRNRSIAQPEETPISPAPPRARSPKKRQDSKHDGKNDSKLQHEDAKQENKQENTKSEAKRDSEQDIEAQTTGKVSDSNSLSEAEQWTTTRKRAASCLDKDGENFEKTVKSSTREASPPQIKRAKRCSRSADSQGQEEEEPEVVPKIIENITQSTQEASADKNLGDICKVETTEEVVSGDGEVQSDGANLQIHKASNGLTNPKKEDETITNSDSTNCLLNGGPSGETSASSWPETVVPCSDITETFAQNEDTIPELIVAKEQEIEEEVDVVGDQLCLAREQVIESNGQPLTPPTQREDTPPPSKMNNSPISNNNNNNDNSNSGDATFSLTEPPTEYNATFSELYEHRYTLRTPPKKISTNGGQTSPITAFQSPLAKDNGPIREDGEVVVGATEEIVPSEMICEHLEDTQDGAVELPIEESKTSEQEKCGGGDATIKTATGAAEVEEEEDEDEEPDVYYFESDHLALKHNKDYQRLLQTIGVLEAQRTQAIVDLETLSRHQQEALDDPISFVEQLQKQVNQGLPCPQRVVQLPEISWEQYTSGLGDFEREFCDKKRKTRRLKLIFDKGLPLRPKSPVEPKKEGECSSMYSPLPTSDALESGGQTQMIRGRICHPNKPDTFNQLWTIDEQKKLEQLLLKFPPEEVESRRWQKIADELGNRTAKQVASRVQKYFIKLTKAGIPVPGRIPNLCMYTKKASTKRQHHLNKHLYRPSTFMASYEPPVYMDEEDERAQYYSSVQDPAAEESDEEVPPELRTLPEYKELLELKRLKKQKLQEIHQDKSSVRHLGFKCDMCGTEPIEGVRWHCQDCPPDSSVDFCSNCSHCLLKTDTHKPTHRLAPVHHPESFLDRDYCLPQTTAGYNYLDPNYYPANR